MSGTFTTTFSWSLERMRPSSRIAWYWVGDDLGRDGSVDDLADLRDGRRDLAARLGEQARVGRAAVEHAHLSGTLDLVQVGAVDEDLHRDNVGAYAPGRQRCKGNVVHSALRGRARIRTPPRRSETSWPGCGGRSDVPVLVVDDGSTDATGEVARAHGADVVRHARNLGKGAAIARGCARRMRRARRRRHRRRRRPAPARLGARRARGRRRPARARARHPRSRRATARPPSNRFGNGVSNFFLSRFAGRDPARHPVRPAPLPRRRDAGARLPRGRVRLRGRGRPSRARGWRAPRRGAGRRRLPTGRGAARRTSDSVRDPTRIVVTVVRTVLDLRLRGQ